MGMLMSLAFIVTSHTTQPPSPSPIVTIKGSLPTLYQLHENFWGELTVDQKFDVANVLINIEASHLGIDIPDIEIDLNSTGHEVLETILYKSFKQYQKAQISAWRRSGKYQNLLLFQQARCYFFEEADLPYSEYSLTELDAKQYALEQKCVYLNEIKNYLFKLERAEMEGG